MIPLGSRQWTKSKDLFKFIVYVDIPYKGYRFLMFIFELSNPCVSYSEMEDSKFFFGYEYDVALVLTLITSLFVMHGDLKGITYSLLNNNKFTMSVTMINIF